jgi:RNA polymerase sigma-70 factor (sigma-E family)
MRAAGRETSSSHEDVLLSSLYQQVTELQEPRFRADYDLEKGLERYRAWLHGQADTTAPRDAAGASGDPEPDSAGAELDTVILVAAAADAVMPDAFPASGTVRAEWSADLAVVELYSRHYRTLVRLAALLVRDTPTAEEVVQDSFIAMHESWQRLKDTEKALAYLRQVVVNRSRSVLRHRTVVDKNLQKAPPDMPSAEHGAFVSLERSAVVAALRDLPDRQREAIVLRYYGDLSEAEIATAMGISRGAVKSHTARGMTALRAALEEE